MSLTLMCGFLVFAFTFDNKGIYWIWAHAEPVAILLVIVTIIFGIFWYKESRKANYESHQ